MVCSESPTNLFIFWANLLYCQLSQYWQTMRKSLALILLLLTAAYAQNCNGCKPAVQIAACPDYHCYKCNQNQVLDATTLQCVCKEDEYRINGFCAQCPEGYSYDPITQWCEGINTCGPNQYLVNGVCQCQPGLVVIQNICQRCPVNQQYYPQYDACRCSPGFSLVSGSCILVNCSVNQIYSETAQACVCVFGYYLINGICGQCLWNQAYQSNTQSCYNLTTPTCGFNSYYYECCCFCQRGYVQIQGQCVTCPQNSQYDYTTSSCLCDPGYYFVGEQVLMLPYQSTDTGSSFTTNPSYSYSVYGPSWSAGSAANLNYASNYDASGVNTNGPNYGNVINVPANGN